MQNIAKHSEWLYLYHQVFPGGSVGKESACNEGDLDLIPELGRSLEEGNGYPIQDSGLENPMDCIVQEVAESDTTERVSLSYLYQENRYKSKEY